MQMLLGTLCFAFVLIYFGNRIFWSSKSAVETVKKDEEKTWEYYSNSTNYISWFSLIGAAVTELLYKYLYM